MKATSTHSLANVRLNGAELAVHALAQMPADVHLDLGCDSGVLDLARLAMTYGVRDRLCLGRTTSGARFASGTTALEFSAAELAALSLADLVETVTDGKRYAVSPQSHELLAGHRVMVITNHPAHYRLPLFDAMARRLEKHGARFRVEFTGSPDPDRPWLVGGDFGFDHGFTRGVRVPIRRLRAPDLPLDLARRIRAFRPTVVLSAGLSPLVSGRVARSVTEEIIVGFWMGETPALAAAGSRARYVLQRRILARADFGIAYGSLSASYLRWLKPDLPVVIGRNTAPVPAETPAIPRAGRHDVFELVLIGDLADARKGIRVALQALQHSDVGALRLTVIGGGALLESLTEEAAADTRVRFLGPLGPDAVRARLADADVLLFPTRQEFFGLVLVEAMGSGVVPMVSNDAGGVADLTATGINAVVIDGHDPLDWAAAIDAIAGDAPSQERMAQRARTTIENRWSISHAADAMLLGVAAGVVKRGRR